MSPYDFPSVNHQNKSIVPPVKSNAINDGNIYTSRYTKPPWERFAHLLQDGDNVVDGLVRKIQATRMFR